MTDVTTIAPDKALSCQLVIRVGKYNLCDCHKTMILCI